MLFKKKTQQVLKVAWVVLAVLIIVSMVLLYTPIFNPAHSTAGAPQQPTPADYQ